MSLLSWLFGGTKERTEESFPVILPRAQVPITPLPVPVIPVPVPVEAPPKVEVLGVVKVKDLVVPFLAPIRAKVTPGLLVKLGAEVADAEVYAPILDEALIVPGDTFNSITSKPGVAMVCAQTSHECGAFSTFSENLNYSVEALLGDARFTDTQARQFGRNPKTGQKADQRTIANIKYNGRYGNRLASDDGWTYRGAGAIQLTFFDNHLAFARAIGMDVSKVPAHLRTPFGAVQGAMHYWRTRGLIVPASQGDVARCTKLIQGGEGGLQSRVAGFKKAMAYLG